MGLLVVYVWSCDETPRETTQGSSYREFREVGIPMYFVIFLPLQWSRYFVILSSEVTLF